MRVYLCDDNPSHRRLVLEVLRDAPEFEVVGGGASIEPCVAEVRELRPDVILLDVAMPGGDGFAALPRFREALPEAKVVMLSTAWNERDERRAITAGADAYVRKPRDVFDLPVLLRGALGDAEALVDHLVRRWMDGDVDRACAALHHDVEYKPLTAPRTLRGIEPMRHFLDNLPPEQRAATVTPDRLLAGKDTVVLLAHAEVGVEHLTPAWVMRVRHGKIARIETFDSWDRARAAGGVG